MSIVEEKPILDQSYEHTQKNYDWINYLALGTLSVGILFDFMDWPFDRILESLGFAGMLTYSAIHFFRKQRALYAWFYFIGRFVLIAGILSSAFHLLSSRYFFIAAAILFALGVLFSWKKKSGTTSDQKEKDKEEEEDLLL